MWGRGRGVWRRAIGGPAAPASVHGQQRRADCSYPGSERPPITADAADRAGAEQPPGAGSARPDAANRTRPRARVQVSDPVKARVSGATGGAVELVCGRDQEAAAPRELGEEIIAGCRACPHTPNPASGACEPQHCARQAQNDMGHTCSSARKQARFRYRADDRVSSGATTCGERFGTPASGGRAGAVFDRGSR